MILVGRELLDDFTKKHSDTREWIKNWISDVENSVWKTPQDVKDRYRSVSFVKELTIFNVKGNSYRLEVIIQYVVGLVTVIWAGPHAAYDERNKKRARK